LRGWKFYKAHKEYNHIDVFPYTKEA